MRRVKKGKAVSPGSKFKRKLKLFKASSTSQSQNQTTPSSKAKAADAYKCHQCHWNRNSIRRRLLNCNTCHKKAFCTECITKWYAFLSEEDVAEKCPVCRLFCNCRCCLRKMTYMPSRRTFRPANKVKHAQHLIRCLYPWLREFQEHQDSEKRMEAEIKGGDAHELLTPKANYGGYPLTHKAYHRRKRIYCNKCNAYIVDFHWSCCNCTCILCLSCCQEMLDPDVPITSKALPCVESDQWSPDFDNNICEIPVLELKSVLGESFTSKLYEEVNETVTSDPQYEGSDGDICKCSCSTKSVRKVVMFCPVVAEVKEEDFDHFVWHWVKGEPVIVRDVLQLTSGLSWDPKVMWRALRDKSNNEKGSKVSTLVVDCRDWSDTEIKMHHFLSGYQSGLSHSDGRPLLLRLKCFHNGSSLYELFPRHREEFMDIMPFPEYTDPWSGPLNLVSYLALDKPRPQLGPEIDIAYGIQEELGGGDSVIKLHYEFYDLVNILMHTTEVHLSVNQLNSVLETHKIKKDEVQKTTITDNYGGALWDIWRREDVPKLRDYITKHTRDFTSCYNLPSSLDDDLLCYGSVYLTMDHKTKLKEEYGIKAWTFVQKLGDSVLVPAGCPYQVRNLKSCIHVMLGFVSPESFQTCLGLADEMRLRSRANDDKVMVKEMAICALSEAITHLKSEKQIVRSKQNFDEQATISQNKMEVEGNTVSDSGERIIPDSQQEAVNMPDPELQSKGSQDFLNHPDKNEVTVDGKADKNLKPGVWTNSESEYLKGDSGLQKENNNSMVRMETLDLTFHDFHYSAPESEFHDFDGDRVEKLFKPDQIWAIYGENDGMPMFYAFIEKMLSQSPFEVTMAFLTPHNDSEFGNINWVSRGFEKTCGEFLLCQYEKNTDIGMFSHQIMWEKGQNGVIKIFPKKGDIWALYRNWSPDWDRSTPDETIYKYDIFEILDEYSEKNGITVAPLVKVNGFNTVFRKDPDPARVKLIPRKEMFRFCYQVPSYRLKDMNAAAKGQNLTGCVELDPSATPMELLKVTAPGTQKKASTGDS